MLSPEGRHLLLPLPITIKAYSSPSKDSLGGGAKRPRASHRDTGSHPQGCPPGAPGKLWKGRLPSASKLSMESSVTRIVRARRFRAQTHYGLAGCLIIPAPSCTSPDPCPGHPRVKSNQSLARAPWPATCDLRLLSPPHSYRLGRVSGIIRALEATFQCALGP